MNTAWFCLVLFVVGFVAETGGHLYCHKDRWLYMIRAENEMATSGYQIGDLLRSPDTLASCSTKCQVFAHT